MKSRKNAFCKAIVVAFLITLPSWESGLAKAKKEAENYPIVITVETGTIRLESESATHIEFDVSLILHFENRSSMPVLLFSGLDWPLLGARTLAGSKEDAVQHNYLYLRSEWPGNNRSSPTWRSLHIALDQPLPPSELVRTIQPGRSWDWKTGIKLWIEKPGSFDHTSKPWDIIRKYDPLWLQVGVATWPNNLERKSGSQEFGKRLQRRWGKQAQLVLDLLVSEPVSLSLPIR